MLVKATSERYNNKYPPEGLVCTSLVHTHLGAWWHIPILADA